MKLKFFSKYNYTIIHSIDYLTHHKLLVMSSTSLTNKNLSMTSLLDNVFVKNTVEMSDAALQRLFVKQMKKVHRVISTLSNTVTFDNRAFEIVLIT